MIQTGRQVRGKYFGIYFINYKYISYMYIIYINYMVNLFFITYMNNFTINYHLVYNADAIHQSQDNYLTDNHIQDYDT